MPNKAVKKLFNYWFERGNQEESWEDGIKFFYFYLSFNIAIAYLSQENHDKDMLNWLKNHPNSIEKAFRRRLESAEFLKQLNILKGLAPIKDNRPKSQEEKPIDSVTNFDQILGAIYQVRCNFFHGSQVLNYSKDQSIIQCSTYILKYWMEVLYTRGF